MRQYSNDLKLIETIPFLSRPHEQTKPCSLIWNVFKIETYKCLK